VERTVYLDRLLSKFGSSFDIYIPYKIKGIEYPAYAYHYTHQEKYVLVKEANMWSADSYEYVLFVETEVIDEAVIEKAKDIIENYFEPELVRKGEKYPAKNHMYSYLTVVIIGNHYSDSKLASKVKRYHFDKGYMFSIRGYSAGRMIAVTMDDEKVTTNGAASKSKKVFKAVFDEVRANKPGF
jgi:hypothetical protein